ncbi:hypothetical protein M9M90_07980 [Phenylobacterium sp. LH3H17]|uniref:hypothetical protein n=1 Tax=Phenylobacterium sp. LH3H17 TaxID=2903901 RepID=UPI0020C9B208|nr:hypothetical protein [Phenylobacterium sp. LH3H17]UTP41105.1 hypothetical protein M9M90_07980 [Phenylobacterium sp. LH3H17]
MYVKQTAPLAIRAPTRPARTVRSKLRRLHVRICRKLRPVFEVAAFFGAALSAVFELFSGRLPSFSATEVSCPPEPEPEPPAAADSPLVPYPVHD